MLHEYVLYNIFFYSRLYTNKKNFSSSTKCKHHEEN